ncbi:unnamed protein product [Adineta ricciae]|uniref:Uncharacterized protein n=1 Tax=Adineta ricciae TaxID=249248 RepID=A0A815ZJU2_ADIRI|nr:unnamed protein product [Adineta ricciae]CAF1583373.1 unnamed protein product [Adineta ricciae]
MNNRMALIKETSANKLNEIFSNIKSQIGSDSESDEYSGSEIEGSVDASEGGNAFIISSSIHPPRLWQISNFKPKLFQFSDYGCGIVCDLDGETLLDFFQTKSFDQHNVSSSHRTK